MPPKRKKYRSKEPSSIRLRRAKQTAERRANMSEAEKNLEREKNRISAKLRRAIMDPETREKFLEKQREEKRAKRRELKIKGLKEELKIIEWQLDTLQGQGEAANLGEKLELETRRGQLEQQIQEIRDGGKAEKEQSLARISDSQEKEENRANEITEEEKEIALEKRRIARNTRRSNITPEEREKVLEKQRVEKRIRRRELKIKELQDQLELLDLELYNLEEEEEAGNDAEKLELETRRDELELKLQEIRDSDPNETLRINNIKSDQSRTRISESQKKAERRANMTEAEKNLEREKNRISAKLRRALMTPKERGKVMEKTRIRRQIKRLQRELKVVEEQLDTLEGQKEDANVDEKLELKTRKGQLELQIQEIREAYPREHTQRTEQVADNSVDSDDGEGTSDQEVNSEPEDSDFDDDANDESLNLADLTYKAAEGPLDPSGVLEMSMMEDNEADQKMRPNETIEEWVERVSSTNRSDNTQAVGLDRSTTENVIEDPQKRLIVMKAKAKLIKLQRPRSKETKSEKQDRFEKISEQKLHILKLMEKYPEEFNLRVAQNKTKERRQRKKEIAAITRNNNKTTKPRKGGRSKGTGQRLRFPKPRFETEAQRIERIAQIIKSKRDSFTNVNETPEELAARIFKEVQEAKEKYNMRNQQVGANASKEDPGSKKRNPDEYLESYRVQKLLETPERRAERISKLVAYTKEKKRMECGEYNLFHLLTSSENPVKTLEDEISAPEILIYWKNFNYRASAARKIPDCLMEWRQKTYSLLNDKGNDVHESKMAECNRKNEDLKKWIEVNGAELMDYLTTRRQKTYVYKQNRKRKVYDEVPEEEREARRRQLNEKHRQSYLKNKLAQGITISPRGEKPHSMKYYSAISDGVVKKRRTPKGSNNSELEGGTPKRRRRSAPKPKKSFYPNLKADADYTDSSSYDTSHTAPPNQGTINTASMYGHSSTGGNHQSLTWQMPTLGLANVSSVEEDHRHEDEQDDGDDDWTPPPNYDERAFEPPINKGYETQSLQSHPHHHHQLQQQQQFVGNQFVGGHNNSIQNSQHETGYDEIFHRLLGLPTQNNYNPFGSQVQNYQTPGQSGASTVIHPNPAHFHQQHYQQIQQHQIQNQNIAQSPYIPLNYSVPVVPQSEAEVEVPWISDTNDCSTIGNKAHQHLGGSIARNTKEQLGRSSGPKITRTRRPNGPRIGPVQTNRNSDPSKGAVRIDSTSATVVLEYAGTTTSDQLKCVHCPKVFHTVRMCQVHMKKAHQLQGTHACKACPQVFQCKKRLTQHYWGQHRKCKPLRCPVCSKEYLKGQTFLSHVKAHPEERNSYFLGISPSKCINKLEKFYCDVCPTAFDSYLKLINHRQEHKYICTMCGIVLKDGDHLLEHTMRCHPEVDWRTKMQEDLYRPIEKTGISFICETCDSEFLTQKFLAVHETRGHPKIESKSKRWCYCGSCDLRLISPQQLDRHEKICPLKNFKCYWCDEVYHRDDLRLKHMMKNHLKDKSIPPGIQGHGGHRMVKCELCRRSYNSILKVRYHFEDRHIPNISKAKKTKQDELAKSVETIAIENTEMEVNDNIFDSSSVITTTNETVHSDPTLSENRNELEVSVDPIASEQVLPPPPIASISNEVPSTVSGPVVVYRCNVCQSKYKTEAFLAKHMNQEHQGRSTQYRYPCDVCNKLFVNPQVLRRHMQNHESSNNKNVQCPYCISKFSRRDCLMTHIKSIHESDDPRAEAKYLQRVLSKQKDKPFKCDVCHSCFMNERYLAEHKKKAHGPAIAPVFCEVCGKQIDTLTPDYCLKSHMKRRHPEVSATLVETTSTATTTARFGQGSVLKRLPLPELIEMIDEVYRVGRYHNPKKPRRSAIPRAPKGKTDWARRSRSKNTAPKTKRKVREVEAVAEESDRVRFSGDSVSDNTDDSESEESGTSESDDTGISTAKVSGATKRRKVSMKNVVIKPKKRVQPKRALKQAKKIKNPLLLTVSMPSINLDRCDDKIDKRQNESDPGLSETESINASRNSDKQVNYIDSESEESSDDNDYEENSSTRRPYSSKRFIMDIDGEEYVSDKSDSDQDESQEEYSEHYEMESD